MRGRCAVSAGCARRLGLFCRSVAPALVLSVFLLSVFLTAARGAEDAATGDGVGLTVYNQDFAIIREHRTMSLAAGRSQVKFEEVAATIVPESVQFRCLEPAGDAAVIEQNYEFDLVNAGKLLHKYVDKPISIVTRDGETIDGTLLSYDDHQLVLAGGEGIELLPRGRNVKDIRFSALPEGLLTRPTLVWQVQAGRGGEHEVEVAYRANRVNWNVNYRAVADKAGQAVDLSGWVTIGNRSGRSYRDAKLKLMAGDVHVVEEERRLTQLGVQRQRPSRRRGAKGAGFEEKSFAEYHLYTLPRPTTIKNNQTKQIELIDLEKVSVTRKYQYRGDGDKVRVVLEFKNDKDTHEGLGIPLPKGPIRVYQLDADEQTEFVGADAIDHTPKKEKVAIRIGTAFEIKGERVRTNVRKLGDRVSEQDWRIRLRNHKDAPVVIEVIETLEANKNWEILEKSQEYVKKDFRTMVFTVGVPADGETVVTYKVRYTW